MKMKVLLFIFLSVGSCLLYQGVSGVDSERVSVTEGDSVTLNTGVKKKQEEKITWFFNGTRIAQINGDQSKICTDVQCNEGTERFKGRLKLDHQTGSLTITNIRTEDSGDYTLLITSGSDSEKIFSVSVRDVSGVSAAEQDEVKRMSVKEGESVTLDPGVMKNPNDSMTWYFKQTLISEITGDQSQICTDDQCKERFRDRLKLDHQTGSLTITNTRNTDSGDYQLQISSNSRRRRRSSINNNIKRFEVSVTGSGLSSSVPGSGLSSSVPGSGLSSAAVAGISVGVVLLVFVAVAAAAGVIFSRHRRSKKDELKERNSDPVLIPSPEMD